MTLRTSKAEHPLDGDSGFNPFGSGPVPIEPKTTHGDPQAEKAPGDDDDQASCDDDGQR